MSVTNYYSISGTIIGERSADRIEYLHDALGSVTGTANDAGSVVKRMRYKPYGTSLWSGGGGQAPRFGWVGQYGYRRVEAQPVYIRARHYGTHVGTWSSKDTLIPWRPYRSVYCYSNCTPATRKDPSGYHVHYDTKSCGSRTPGNSFCKSLAQYTDDQLLSTIAKCMRGQKGDKLFTADEQSLAKRSIDFMRRACNGTSPRVCVYCGVPPDWPCSTVGGKSPCEGHTAVARAFVKDSVLPPQHPDETLASHGKDYQGRAIACKTTWMGRNADAVCDELLRRAYPNCDCIIMMCKFDLPEKVLSGVLGHELLHCAGILHLRLEGNRVDPSDFPTRFGCCLCRAIAGLDCSVACQGVKDVHSDPRRS